MATTLGAKSEGSIVKIKENGVLVDFYVAKQNYESGLNGAGRVLVVRKDCYGDTWWADTQNNYSLSHIDTWLNGDYKSLLDADICAVMGTTKFYYTYGNGGIGMSTLERSVFLLSCAELGEVRISVNNEGTELPIADILKIAYLDGSAVEQFTRSPYNGNITYVVYISSDGRSNLKHCSSSAASRPAFTLPSILYVNDDGSVSVNTAPTSPGSITIPETVQGGSTITVEWGSSTDAQSNLEGYVVQRSVDGGSAWTQIYQGSALTTTNTVPFGTEDVMYRVRAYDSEGLYSGWRTSGQVTVINNTAPTVPDGITVPEAVQGGQPLDIAWGPSTDGENNLAGYGLERQVDGGDWEAVYTGPGLAFTDQITKGWQTVAYRVRAYDDVSAYSGFAVSETREVNNNTPPAIVCEYPANTPLGLKNEGFEIPYTVEDEEGDAVTVTEAVDGAALRTFSVELGGENSFQLTGEAYMRILNGTHTLSITACDGSASAVHSLGFTKAVTEASVKLAQPMEADGPISVCVLSVSGFIPEDAEYSVEVTNNALDEAPVWEDCTATVRAGVNHVFENQTAANGFAFDFRLHVSRGESGVGGYITSVQGGFQ